MERIHIVLQAIDAKRTLFNLVETGDQFGERGFAAARVANKSHLATCRNMQIDAFQDWSRLHIAKDNILKGNLTFQYLWAVVRKLSHNHFGLLVDYFQYVLSTRAVV